MKTQFVNRSGAGQFLAETLSTCANCDDVLVLALPRGCVPVAAEVAKKLNALLVAVAALFQSFVNAMGHLTLRHP